MSLKETLDHLLEVRKAEKDAQAKSREALKERKETVDTLEKAMAGYRMLNINEKDRLFGSGSQREALDYCEGHVPVCADLYQKAVEDSDALVKRFSRKTINLTVIGRIGAGKSRLLQTISGLDNDCIPSLDGPSVTGTTSIIEHKEIDKARAILTFKTKEEALNHINEEIGTNVKALKKHFDSLDPDNYHVDTLEKEPVQRTLDKLHDVCEKLHREADQKHRGEDAQKASGLIDDVEELKKLCLVGWDDWFPLLGLTGGSSALGKYRLHYAPELGIYTEDREVIRTYVSKHDGNDSKEHREHYYHFFAVKEALIQVRLPKVDARLRLLDTVGIRDKRSDTRQRIKDAVAHKSDGVIFLLAFGDNRTDDIDIELKELMKDFQVIFKEYKDRAAAQWMAFVINVKPVGNMSMDRRKNYAKEFYDNLCQPRNFGGREGVLGENGIGTRAIIDAADGKDVNDFLISFLGRIAHALPQIDRQWKDAVSAARREAEVAGQALCERLSLVSAGAAYCQTHEFVTNRMRERLDQLRKRLKDICGEDVKSGQYAILDNRLSLVRALRDGSSDVPLPDTLEDMIKRNANHSSPKISYLYAQEDLHAAVRKIGVSPVTNVYSDRRRAVIDTLVDELGLELDVLGLDAADPRFFTKFAGILLEEAAGDARTAGFVAACQALDHTTDEGESSVVEALFNFHAAKYISHNSIEAFASGSAVGRPPKEGTGQKGQVSSKEQFAAYREEKVSPAVADVSPADFKEALKRLLDDFIGQMESLVAANEGAHFFISASERLQAELFNFLLYLDDRDSFFWSGAFKRLFDRQAILRAECRCNAEQSGLVEDIMQGAAEGLKRLSMESLH